MHNILIIAETQSYIIMSLKEKFEELSYKVIIVKADMEAVRRIEEPIGAMLVYADGELSGQQQALNYIKDKAVEDDTVIFIMGDMDEIQAVEKLIPKHMVPIEFKRPINVALVCAEIDNYVTKYGKHNKKKILVVDDSGAMLRNVKGWLEDHYQVILANSGMMAIKYLTLNRPDLVLLDYEMPVCDGRQVLEMIRTETEFADIPVIFLTSRGDKESVLEVMALKPDGYLLKTMPPAEIIRSVDEFFERKKAMSGFRM